MRSLYCVAAAVMTVAAVPASAQMMGTAQPATTPAAYVAAAGAADQYEIQSSRLVLQTTRDAKVRAFANMMIAHHTKSTRDVAAAARRANVAVAPPMLMPEQQQMIDRLRAATGAARDTLYWDQQRMAHQQALALHQSYAANGTATPLRQAAATVVPVVERHIARLERR